MKRWKIFLISSCICSVLSFIGIMIYSSIAFNKEASPFIDGGYRRHIYDSLISEYILWILLVALAIGIFIGVIAILIVPHTSKNFKKLDPNNFPTDISYNDLRELYKRKYIK